MTTSLSPQFFHNPPFLQSAQGRSYHIPINSRIKNVAAKICHSPQFPYMWLLRVTWSEIPSNKFMNQQCNRAVGFVLKEDVTARCGSKYPHTHPVSAKGGLYALYLIYARGCEELTFLQGNLSPSVCTAATEGQKSKMPEK